MKEIIGTNGIKKKLLSAVLTLTMIIAKIPSMSITVFAASDPVLAETITATADCNQGTNYKIESKWYADGIWYAYSTGITVTATGSTDIAKLVFTQSTTGVITDASKIQTDVNGAQVSIDADNNITVENINTNSLNIKCSGDYIYLCQVTIYRNSHTCGNLTEKDGQAATCTEDGWKEYWLCSCGKVYAANSTAGTAYASADAWKVSEDGKIAMLGHSWRYNASDATLSATCTRNSAHTATLTLTASDANYSGSPVSATLDGSAAWTDAGLTAPTIKYSGTDSTSYDSETAPTNAGTYEASITVDSKTAKKAFTINKATISTSDVTLTQSTYVYDNTNRTPTIAVVVSGKNLTKNTDYEVSGTTTAKELSTGNGYAVTVTGKGNYTGSVTKYWTITKEPITITTWPTASAIDYGQTLSNSTLTGGNPDSSTGTWAWVEPNTKPNVGKSNHKVKFTPNDKNYGPAEQEIAVTVNQKALTASDITVTAPNATGSDLTNSVVVKFGSTTLVKGIDYTITFEPTEVKDEGKYKAIINFKGNYSGTNIEKEFTVSKRSSGGGGGGTSAPSTNATIGGETGTTTNVSVSTSGGQATVSDIPKNTVDSIANSNANGGDIVLDVSKAGNSQVTKVTLTKSTVENISKALDSSDNNKTNLVVKTGNAEVTFDAAAVKAIAAQASAGNIQIIVENTTGANLNNSQKKVVEDLGKGNGEKQVVQTFEASIISGGQKISNFMGGNVTVAQINFTVPAGKKASNFHIYYIPTSGAAEKCVTWVKDGRIYFITGHFSDYVIVYDETVSNGEGIPVYRLYHGKLGDHLFTTNAAERDAAQKIGYKLEGVGFYASGTGNKVYRLCNPRSGEHFYTTSEAEKNACVAADWRLEGIAFTTEGEKKVYRLYNGKVHFYTTSEKEKDFCLAHGWKLEGVGFTAN